MRIIVGTIRLVFIMEVTVVKNSSSNNIRDTNSTCNINGNHNSNSNRNSHSNQTHNNNSNSNRNGKYV